MNKYLVIVLLCNMLVAGCIKEKEYSFTEVVSLINETPKDVLLYFESSFGSDTLFTDGLDTASYSYTEVKRVDSHLAGSSPNYEPIHIISLYELYDITDTLSYILRIEPETIYSSIDSIFIAHFDKYSKVESGVNQVKEHILKYDSFIDTIMKKDYTMLEKFSGYYSKQ